MNKSWYQSKTIWGLAVAALATVLQRYGIGIGAADQAELVDTLTVLAQTAGAVVAIWGRARAQGPLGTGGVETLRVAATLVAGGWLSACAVAPALPVVAAGAGATYLAYVDARGDVAATDGTGAKVQVALKAYCAAHGVRALDRAALATAMSSIGMDQAGVDAIVASLAASGNALCAAADSSAP